MSEPHHDYLESTLHRFLDDLASDQPTPGGGSAAALMGATAAGLVGMVGHFTVGRKKYEAVEAQAWDLIERSNALREEFGRLMQADIAAFGEVSDAYKRPKATDEEKVARSEAIQAALVTATEAPLAICRAAVETLSLCETMAALGNAQVISDIGVGALSADACLRSAEMNIEINLHHMKDEGRARRYAEDRDELMANRAERLERILDTVRKRL